MYEYFYLDNGYEYMARTLKITPLGLVRRGVCQQCLVVFLKWVGYPRTYLTLDLQEEQSHETDAWTVTCITRVYV